MNMNVVVEGRDMTTVVFPDTPYRFYLDADPAERAKRRYNERAAQGVTTPSLAETERQIRERDEIDAHKEEGSLYCAPGVERIDTTHLTIDEVYETMNKRLPAQTEGRNDN
jgi:cytidylate kinase